VNKPVENQGARIDRKAKKAYATPRIAVYGDFRKLTQGKGAAQADGATSTRFGA
jgi:hypothetical protein